MITNRVITPKPGQIVEKSEWGGGTCYVEIETVHEEIKNGRPGFVGHIVRQVAMQSGRDPIRWKRSGSQFDGKWGYNDQIVRIVRDV